MNDHLPEEKEELYERIQGQGIIINKAVWDSIYHCVNDNIGAIIFICQHYLANNEPIPVEDAKKILTFVKDIKYTINPITKTLKDSLNFTQSRDSLPLNLIIQQLIKHQFGNDVYAIELMLRDAIDPLTALSIPLEVTQKILNHAQTIKESIEKFKDVIQQKEEKIYHNLYDSFKDGLILTDMKGSIFDVNRAYLDMLGYSEEEIKKLNSRQLTPQIWHKKEEEIIGSLITKKDNSAEYEKEYIKKDGGVFLADIKVWLIKDAQGNPLGIWGIVRDLSERSKTQKEFEEDIFSSHTVIDNVSTGLSLSDKRGHFVIFNHRMQEITGYTMEEINEKDLGVLLYPDSQDREKAIGRLNMITVGDEVLDIETKIKTKDGLERIVSVSTSLMNYKGSEMFLSVWRDITENRLMQNALEDSEVRFRRLFETAQDGILILDADTGQIREVNPFLINMLGYSREEFLGKELWEVGAFIDIDKSKTAFQTLQTKGYVRYEDLPLQAKDGSLINVEFVSNVYNVNNTKVIQCNIRDITERKRLANKLFEANGELMEANAQLEQLALKDSHTGFYNHRYLKEAMEANFALAQRQATPLSVIMMDIDYFKSINDVYGHVFGDLVLKQFAEQINKTVRTYDVVIRYGGEEFVVISPDTDRTGAQALAKRILENVNLYSFGNKEQSIKLKLSLAVAAYPEDAIQKSADMVDCVDRILNKAKENGGNRVYSSLDIKNTASLAPQASSIDSLKDKIKKLTIRASQGLVEEIMAFAKTIELKDHYTGKHVEKTVGYAAKIAQGMHLTDDKVELVKEAAMLHDLGKVGISDHILHKKSKLSSEEFEEIKRHPQIGVDIIRPIHSLHPIIPLLLHHHERWDGKGYPNGLSGYRIPLGARIIAIADVYQALISNRPYRKAYSKEKAAAIIKEASGTQFDPDIVKTFLAVLEHE